MIDNSVNDKVIEAVQQLRTDSPLTQCITKVVTVKDCANAVLAVGGSPIMANEPEEAEEITGIANSLLINIGTLTTSQVETMKKSAKKAVQSNIPLVLDPVGVGISKIRNQTPIDIITESKPTIIRGNLSEIKAIAMLYGILDECTKAKGVDVAETDVINEETISDQAVLVKNIASKLNTVIAVSGPIDIISDGESVYTIRNGDAMMSRITGTGCMLGCVIASYAAITTPLVAAITGTLVMGIAGQKAAIKVETDGRGTGSFGVDLIDELSLLNEETLTSMSNLTKME